MSLLEHLLAKALEKKFPEEPRELEYE